MGSDVLGRLLPGNMPYSVINAVSGSTECATLVSVNFFAYLQKEYINIMHHNNLFNNFIIN